MMIVRYVLCACSMEWIGFQRSIEATTRKKGGTNYILSDVFFFIFEKERENLSLIWDTLMYLLSYPVI